MINRTKFAIIVGLAVTSFAATPAFAQSFDRDFGTGNVLPYNSQPAAAGIASRHTARGNGMDAYAMEPRTQLDPNSNSPASAGGGSTGYNENLYNY